MLEESVLSQGREGRNRLEGLMRLTVRMDASHDSLLHFSRGIALLRRADAERPAFVMMDPNTSGTDGREALRQFKAAPLLKAIPLVVVTTLANPHDLDLCYQYGANADHVKPVRYRDHLQMLAGLLDY